MQTRFKLAIVLVLAVGLALAAPKHHNDVFMRGPANQTQLAEDVRHQLLMLPIFILQRVDSLPISPRFP